MNTEIVTNPAPGELGLSPLGWCIVGTVVVGTGAALWYFGKKHKEEVKRQLDHNRDSLGKDEREAIRNAGKAGIKVGRVAERYKLRRDDAFDLMFKGG